MSSKVGDLIVGSGYIVQRGGGKDYSVFKARSDGSLTEVTAEMLDGITTIAGIAFYGCPSLKSVIIPNSVRSIQMSAFASCQALKSVTIPSSVTWIMESAFYSCSALTSVTIPSSVTNIGSSAFRDCSVLASVTVEATTPPTLGNNVFSNTSSNLVIYVPSESVGTYKSASVWSTYASKIHAIPST